jgi:predicted DNA-binding protein (MmcQ/YjbR family)
VPDQLRDNTLFAMAQTFFVADGYKSAIKVMNKWFSVVQDVQPDAYILLTHAYYQLQDYNNAKPPIHLLQRAYRDYGDPRYERLATLANIIAD